MTWKKFQRTIVLYVHRLVGHQYFCFPNLDTDKNVVATCFLGVREIELELKFMKL